MRPQQRPARDSRQLSPQRPPFRVGLFVNDIQTDANVASLTIAVVNQPPLGGTVNGQIMLYGLPAIVRHSQQSICESATFDPVTSILRVVFSDGELLPGEYLFIGPQDESMRGHDGSYVAAVRLVVPGPL